MWAVMSTIARLHHGGLVADVDDARVRGFEVVAHGRQVVGELRDGRIDLRAGGGEGIRA